MIKPSELENHMVTPQDLTHRRRRRRDDLAVARPEDVPVAGPEDLEIASPTDLQETTDQTAERTAVTKKGP